MTDRADERAKVDRTKDPDDPNKDVREEYTSYREREPDQAKPDSQALREADLQPGTPTSEEVVEESGEGGAREGEARKGEGGKGEGGKGGGGKGAGG